jgi:MscS family membrane protein
MHAFTRRVSTAFLLAVATLGTFVGLAPEPAAAQSIPGVTPPATEAPANPPPEVPAALRSPRATMRTFIESVVHAAQASDNERAEHMRKAVACLDLSDIPAGVRGDIADDLAVKLKEVIDRIRFVTWDSIPDTEQGEPWVFHRESAIKAEITIQRVADGRWLFSTATVSRIPEMYAHFEDRAKVAGIVDTSVSMSLSPALWLRSHVPEVLRDRWFLMEHWQWLVLISLIALGWLIGRIVRALLAGPVQRFLEARSFRVPNHLIQRVLEPLNLVAMGLVWIVGIRWIGLNPDIAAVALVIFKFLMVFGFLRIALRVITAITFVFSERAKLTSNKFDDLAVPFFDKTAKVVVFSIGILFIADVFGVSPASLLAGLGLGGLAVALAAQDTVKNLFGSFTVILDRPFEVGDGIKLNNDVQGTVEEVGFRSTRLRSWDNTLITVPNGNLIAANVENLGKRTFFRYRAFLNLTYDTPAPKVEAFCAGVESLIRAHPHTRKEAFWCRFHEFGAHSLDLLVVCHFRVTEFAEFATAKHELLLDILNLASRLGVEFAFPTRTIQIVPTASEAVRDEPELVVQQVYLEARARGDREAASIALAARPVPPETAVPTDVEV